MLQGDPIALAADAVANDGHRTVIICQGCILHHSHVPQKGIVPLLCLKDQNHHEVMHIYYISLILWFEGSFLNGPLAHSLSSQNPHQYFGLYIILPVAVVRHNERDAVPSRFGYEDMLYNSYPEYIALFLILAGSQWKGQKVSFQETEDFF